MAAYKIAHVVLEEHMPSAKTMIGEMRLTLVGPGVASSLPAVFKSAPLGSGEPFPLSSGAGGCSEDGGGRLGRLYFQLSTLPR